jgi:asparagine synthase (glutamine-hydrolysing)
MSAIAGIIHFDGRPVEPGQIEAMTAAMHARGPDGIFHWRKGKVALGQCTLRTTPESLEETLPLLNEDESLVLVMDGRVDNYIELRRKLLSRQALLRTKADAELVLRAYEVWGENCADHIIGDFVFFIWDARRDHFFSARDAVGARHYYFHSGPDWFGFSSDIKGLLALKRIELKLNPDRLLNYLMVDNDSDDQVSTFYQTIDRLPAGHAMLVSARGVKTWRYWHPGNLPASKFASLDECKEEFLFQLRGVVQSLLRSNRPVAAMLSGGLDSSSIVGLISKEFRSELIRPLTTISLIDSDRQNCLDWPYIQEMLNDHWLSSTILESSLFPDPGLAAFRYLRLSGTNQPHALIFGLLDVLLYSTAREQGCGALFDGMAGDLHFYGMERSLDCAVSHKLYRYIPNILSAFDRHGVTNGRRRLMRSALRGSTPLLLLQIRRKLLQLIGTSQRTSRFPGDISSLLDPDVVRNYVAARVACEEQTIDMKNEETDQMSHARNFTSGMLSQAHEVSGPVALALGVEPRSPYSDRRMIEFSIRMPVEAKLSDRWYKSTMRSGMRGILPNKVTWRRKIAGHPGHAFYREFIGQVAENEIQCWDESRIMKAIPVLDAFRFKRLWTDYSETGNPQDGVHLLTIALLADWLAGQGL